VAFGVVPDESVRQSALVQQENGVIGDQKIERNAWEITIDMVADAQRTAMKHR
jgi:hypothetical protein